MHLRALLLIAASASLANGLVLANKELRPAGLTARSTSQVSLGVSEPDDGYAVVRDSVPTHLDAGLHASTRRPSSPSALVVQAGTEPNIRTGLRAPRPKTFDPSKRPLPPPPTGASLIPRPRTFDPSTRPLPALPLGPPRGGGIFGSTTAKPGDSCSTGSEWSLDSVVPNKSLVRNGPVILPIPAKKKQPSVFGRFTSRFKSRKSRHDSSSSTTSGTPVKPETPSVGSEAAIDPNEEESGYLRPVDWKVLVAESKRPPMSSMQRLKHDISQEIEQMYEPSFDFDFV